MAAKWSDEEIAYLKNNYGNGKTATRIIADILGRDENCIRAKVHNIGLKCEKRVLHKSCVPFVQTEADEEFLKKRGYKLQKKRRIEQYTYYGNYEKAINWQICHDIINMIRYKAGMELSREVSPYDAKVERVVEYIYKPL